MSSSDIVRTADAQAVFATPLPPDVDLTRISYEELASNPEMFSVPGFGLVDDKAQLLGVPHIVVGVTFQIPLKDATSKFGERDYVTLRAVVADERTLAYAASRGWIPGKVVPFRPNELICYNDGSTGVRRDIVKILDAAGLIEVGHHDEKDRYDMPWSMWDSFSQSAEQGDNIVPEFVHNPNGNLFTLRVDRGLRVSTYQNEYTKEGMTYYL
jgi:hypothetical protein